MQVELVVEARSAIGWSSSELQLSRPIVERGGSLRVNCMKWVGIDKRALEDAIKL